MKSTLPFACMILAACSQQPQREPHSDRAGAPFAIAPDRFQPSAIDSAKAAIKAEPKVIDLLFDESNAVEWHVAVTDDGSRRYGYAGYICQLLREHGAYDENVDVRVIDAAKRAEFRDAYRDYSLGAVRCSDNSHLD